MTAQLVVAYAVLWVDAAQGAVRPRARDPGRVPALRPALRAARARPAGLPLRPRLGGWTVGRHGDQGRDDDRERLALLDVGARPERERSAIEPAAREARRARRSPSPESPSGCPGSPGGRPCTGIARSRTRTSGCFDGRHAHRLRAVGGLRDDVEASILLEDDPEEEAVLGGVVGEDDTDPVAHSGLSGCGQGGRRRPDEVAGLQPALVAGALEQLVDDRLRSLERRVDRLRAPAPRVRPGTRVARRRVPGRRGRSARAPAGGAPRGFS